MQDRKLELQKAIANVIKRKRKYSISKICLEIDMSKSLWSILEKGSKDINISTFWRIAEGFDIKPSELMAEIEKEIGDKFSFIEDSSGNQK
ncbi:helix-turn-helix transcriptional regulator [bacterium]|nr:helix-turn-helix transcriptional regulator [bacterium]